jgi:uncharacterized protein YjiS (DUF1127 family)
MFDFLSRLTHRVRSRFTHKLLFEKLSRLDDHLLMDIGLRRDQLETVVLNAADDGVPSKPLARQHTVAARRPQHSLQGCG